MSVSTSRFVRCAVVCVVSAIVWSAQARALSRVQPNAQSSAESKASAAPAADDAALLAALEDEQSCLDAMQALARRGAQAVPLLLQAMRDARDRGDVDTCLRAVYALGRLGDAGAEAALPLLDELPNAMAPVIRNIYWALAEVGPAADGGRRVVSERLARCNPRPGVDHQEWAFACRCVEVGTRGSPRAIVDLLESDEHAADIAAVGLLMRMPVGADVPRDVLLARFRVMEQAWRQMGSGWSRAPVELARAVVRHGGRCEEVCAANRMLVYHYDFEVRMHAAMRLGQDPGVDVAATVRALTDALDDGWVRARRESVTALAMLGTAAQDAKQRLVALSTGDADAQVRVRAAAAVRAVGGQR